MAKGNDFYGNINVFTAQENAAIASSTKNNPAAEDDGHGDGNLGYAQLTGEHVFLLDAVEATRLSYGYADQATAHDTRIKSGTADYWWLRSPFSYNDFGAGYVYPSGYIHSSRVAEDTRTGVSPAFNLDLSSVIFSSLIPNKTNEYKLTVKDTNMTIAQTGGQDITRAGNVVTVPYTITGANAENATQVSVLIITDDEYSPGTVATTGYSYQKLNVTTWGTSGMGTFTIPDAYADKTCGTDYYAYILAEDVNGDYETDYASTPVSITVPQKPILTISANDITLEYNGQTQGPGDTVYADPAEIAKLVTVTGLLDGDTLTSITIDGQGQDVGDYELTPSQAAISNGSETVTDKYDINFVKGTLHIVTTPKNLQLGASALADNAGASGAATVYYGKNNQTWRVIGYGTAGVASENGKLALLAGTITGSSTKFNEYSSGQECNNYNGSKLQEAMNALLSDTYFSSKERDVIAPRNLAVEEYKGVVPYSDGVSGTAVDSQKLWPLSAKEAYTLYNNGSGITNIAAYWWLRSPGYFDCDAANVDDYGDVYYYGYSVDSNKGVRPAFNINLSSILFTSAAVDGKKTETLGTLTAPADYTGTDWKLTIKDPSLVINPGNAYKSGDTVTVSYTFTGSPNRISVLITDKDYTANDAKIKYYGAIAEGSSLGKSATFTLPGDVADTDKLYLLAETVNGDKRTDIASVPVLFSIGTLRTYTVAFDANGGTGRMDSVTRSEDDGNSLPVNRFVYPRRKFTGWNTEKDGTGRSYSDGYKGNVLKTDGSLPFPGDTMTLYAQWDWGEIPEDIRTDIFKNDMSKVRERDVWFAFRYDGAWHEDTAALKKTYTGEKITFTEDIAVFHGFWKLWENRDYTIRYSDNTKAAAADAVKAPAVTIKGRGSYTARSQHKFTIEAVDINRAEVTSEEVIVVKTGTKIGKTKPAASYDGKKLRHGSDYETVFYEGSEIDASKEIKDKNLVLREKDKTYLVTIKGKGNFRDEKKAAIIKTADPKDRNTVRVSTLKVTDTKGKKLKIKIPYDELTKKGTVSGNFAEYIKGYFDNSKTGAKAQLMDGKNVLVYGRDYTVSAPEGGSAGTYRIVINGTGDQASGKKYIGTKSIKAEVTGTKMSSVKIAGLASRVGYLGRDIGLADVFDKNDKKLESGWEEVTLYAAGKDGTKKKLARSSDGVTGDYILTMVNTGAASRTETYLCPVVRTRTVTDDDGTQRQETYISWEPRKIEKGGRFLFIVTGINGYTGTVSRTVRIRPYDIREKNTAEKKIKVTIDDSRCEYSKSGAFPIVAVSFNGIGLREGIDYKLTFKNNKKVAADLAGMDDNKKPSVIIKGIGNFKGKTLGGYFRIHKSDIGSYDSTVSMTADDVEHNAKGKAGYFIVKPVVADGDRKLKQGRDMEAVKDSDFAYTYVNAVTFPDGTVKPAGSAIGASDKVPAGTVIQVSAKVKCPESSNYTSESGGTLMTCTYKVVDKAKNIKYAKVTITDEAKKKLTFNNGYATPLNEDDFTVTLNGVKLSQTDYEIISVKNTSLVGKATVVLRGRGEYSGKKKTGFNIGKKDIMQRD